MIVVSNTSPIINLAAIGELDLLRQCYGKIIIPQAVYDEIAVVGAGEPGSTEVHTLPWFETKPVTSRTLVTALSADLDGGEAETIALAVELKADLVLLDERRGRIRASQLGLRFIGLLGVLVSAKQNGYIPAIKRVLDDLVTKAGFWVSSQLYRRVRQAAGE